jgi:cytochrome c-type biogenesis protein CcmH
VNLMTALPLLVGIFIALAPAAGTQQQRIQRLEGMVLAPCCYSEPVSIHRSDIALQMKVEIANWVRDGKSDDEILGEYKQRYGARVLIEPEGSVWWWVNLIPGMAFAAGLVAVAWLIRRWLKHRPVESV